MDGVADGGTHRGLAEPERDGDQHDRDRQQDGEQQRRAERREHQGHRGDRGPETARASAAPIRIRSGPTKRGTNRATAALGTSSRPTCQASQPSPTSTAGTAMSSANHAAGTAAAASALRTTVPLRTTDARQEAVAAGARPAGRPPGRRAGAGAGRPRRRRPGGRRLDQQHQPPAVAGHEDRADEVEPGAAAAPGERAPEERQHQRAQDRQRHHGAPAEGVLDGSADERAEAAHRGGHARPAGRGPGPRTSPAYRALRRATPSVGTAAAPAPWNMRATSRVPKLGAKRGDERAGGHQTDPEDERQPDPDQVGHPAVDRGGDGEHQHVEADRPAPHADADAEVVRHQRQRDRRRGRAHPRQAEEQAEQQGHAAGVVHGSPNHAAARAHSSDGESSEPGEVGGTG